ncbi:hypothetical protein [Candidatus Pantoea persica]|nr:hypothetical protein [Candidatus Pantoea persica]
MRNQMNSFTPAWVTDGTAVAVAIIPGRRSSDRRLHQSSLVDR